MISPSGQYLYISAQKYLYQLDLFSDDIEASQIRVAEYDGYADPIATNFGRCIMGPDCKIYVFPGNDSRVIHIIHNPNEPGLACNFEQHALHTPTYHGATFPNLPDFRLGAIGTPVSPCEGYTVPVREAWLPVLPALSVYPNPAHAYLNISASAPLSAPARWVLYDLYGRALRSLVLAPGAGQQWQVSISDVPAGVYVWRTSGGGSGKVVKE